MLEKLKGFEHTFTHWIAKQFAALYKAEPEIEKVADAVLQYAVPAVQIIVSAEAGKAAGDAVGVIAAKVQAGLHAASALIYDFGASPTAASVLAGVQKDLDSITSVANIGEATKANVSKVVATLGALVAALPSAAPAA